MVDLLDPVALEERLKEARARRALALAGRNGAEPSRPTFADAAASLRLPEAFAAPAVPSVAPDVAPPVAPAPAPQPAPALPAAAAAPAEPATAPAPGRLLAGLVRIPVWAIFLTGLSLGAAVVAVVALTPTTRPPAQGSTAPVAVAESAAPTAAAVASVTPPAVTVEPEMPAPAEAPPPVAAPAASPAPVDAGPATPSPAELPRSGLAAPAREPAAVPTDALETARLATVDAPLPPAPDPAPASASASVAPEPAAPAAPVLPTRVTIHYPPSAAAEAERASAALSAAGVARVAILPVRLDISRSNVRYYHAGDAAAAAAVTALLGDGGEPPVARDFTDYKTPAAPGALEIWLAGDSGTAAVPRTRPRAAASTAPTVAAPEPPAAAAPTRPVAGTFLPDSDAPLPVPTAPPAPIAPQDQAQAVARIIVERAYQRLMEVVPGN